jgi:hypothetical protein
MEVKSKARKVQRGGREIAGVGWLGFSLFLL